MITTVLVAMLLAASPTDAAYAARDAYLACIDTELRDGLDKKVEPDAFNSAVVVTCQPKLDAWKTAYLAADAADGIKAKDSAESFKVDADDFLDSAKDRYKDYFDTKTSPAKKG